MTTMVGKSHKRAILGPNDYQAFGAQVYFLRFFSINFFFLLYLDSFPSITKRCSRTTSTPTLLLRDTNKGYQGSGIFYICSRVSFSTNKCTVSYLFKFTNPFYNSKTTQPHPLPHLHHPCMT